MAKGNDGQGQSDDVRGMLRQLAGEIKGQIADVDRKAMISQQSRPAQRVVEDDPWDMASAEALTRVYEGDPRPVAPIGMAPLMMASPPQQPAPAQPAAGRTTSAPIATQPIYFADPPIPEQPVQRPSAPTPEPTRTTVKPRSPMPASAQPESSRPAMPLASTLIPQAAAPAAAAVSLLATDRAWLDERLADLQSKVEATLSSFDPAPIVAPLTERVDRLEDHLMDALGTVAQKEDLERFGVLEADVAAIKGHVEAARDQLKRLDNIEGHLRDLQTLAANGAGDAAVAVAADPETTKRLSEIETIVRDLHNFVADQSQVQAQQHTPEPPDFHGLAAKAADRAAANVVEQYKDLFAPSKRAEMAQLAQAAGGASLQEMQSLLDAYQDEQRREASQTAATLTTMQEALIRLIDRIEELAGEAPAEEAAVPVDNAPRFVDVEDERGRAPGRRSSDHPTKQMSVDEALQVQQTQAQQAQQVQQAQMQAMAAAAAAPAAKAPMPITPPPRAPRAAPVPAAADANIDAAAAMAAERARVQAERGGRRPPMPRPQMQVAAPSEPEADADATATIRKPRKAERKGPSMAVKIGGLAALSLLTIGGAVFAFQYLGFNKKVGPLAAPVAPKAIPGTPPAPQATSRPAIPSETPEVTRPAVPSAQPAQVPTPALPEAQPNRDARPQPAAGQPLTQPPARVAPAPQVAPQPQGQTQPGQRTRTMPETVTDDLTENMQTPDQARPATAGIVGAQVTPAAVQGIALDNSNSLPNPAELARRQSSLAPSEAIETTGEALARGRAELPPAAIGPTSLRVAAQNGDPSAQFEVGTRFAEAKGVKQDFQQAVIWYSRAAQQGFVPAQYRLATIYEGGQHGTQDVPRAKVWYKRAADQGHVKAMHNLAVLAAGNGATQPDYQTAARWFAEAADRGLADSQFNLGVLHESGLGVTRDQLQAYKWFALAARSGDKEALRRRDQIMATLTPQAAQTAEKLVNSWRARPTDMKANDPRTAGLAHQQQQAAQVQQMQEQQAQATHAAQLRQQQQELAQKQASAPATGVTAKVHTMPKGMVGTPTPPVR